MWGIKIQRGIRNVKREPTENSLSLLRSTLKGSAEASLVQLRELTSAHLFHLQGLSWTTSRCPSSSFVVPLYGSSVILHRAFSHVLIPRFAQRSRRRSEDSFVPSEVLIFMRTVLQDLKAWRRFRWKFYYIYIYIWEEKKESIEILIFRADDESAMRQSKLDGGLKISV